MPRFPIIISHQVGKHQSPMTPALGGVVDAGDSGTRASQMAAMSGEQFCEASGDDPQCTVEVWFGWGRGRRGGYSWADNKKAVPSGEYSTFETYFMHPRSWVARQHLPMASTWNTEHSCYWSPRRDLCPETQSSSPLCEKPCPRPHICSHNCFLCFLFLSPNLCHCLLPHPCSASSHVQSYTNELPTCTVCEALVTCPGSLCALSPVLDRFALLTAC